MNSIRLVQVQSHLIQLKNKPLDKSFATILKRIMNIFDAVTEGVEKLIARHRIMAETYLSALDKGIKPTTTEGLIEEILLNEGKLEAFEEALNSLIEVKYFSSASNNQKAKQVSQVPTSRQTRTSIIRTFELPINEDLKADFVSSVNWQSKSLDLYNLANRASRRIDLRQHQILPFSSYLHCRGSIYIIGGAIPHSNSKSSAIYKCHIANEKTTRVGELLEARSSHATLFKHPHIYIVGGNRHNHIITKSCERYNILSQEVQQIACLNHCAAGVALTSHGNYIYKFGGVGEKFESYGMSPYIERYDIEQDCWDVVNPDFSPKLVDRDSFQVLSFCCSFVLDPHTIVVMGGYDKDKQPHRFGYALSIGEDDEYTISNIDEVFLPEAGGFWHNTPTYWQGQLYFIMNSPPEQSTFTTPSTAFHSKSLLQYDGSTFVRLF